MGESVYLSRGQMVLKQTADERLTNSRLALYGGNFIQFMYEVAHKAAYIYAGTEVVNANIGDVSILRPIFVGEAAFTAARVTYVGKTSLETECYVVLDDENLTPVVMAAHFTFVARGRDGKPALMPEPLSENEAEEMRFEAGRLRKEALVAERSERKEKMGSPILIPEGANESLVVPREEESRSLRAGYNISTYLVFPEDIDKDMAILGGKLAGYMDNTAAAAAAFYSGEACVTVSMHGIHFEKRLRRGEFAVVAAQVEYVGNSSLIVRIDVDRRAGKEREAIVRDACYGFVAVGEDNRPVRVPPPIIPADMMELNEKARLMQLHMKRTRENAPKSAPLVRVAKGALPVFV